MGRGDTQGPCCTSRLAYISECVAVHAISREQTYYKLNLLEINWTSWNNLNLPQTNWTSSNKLNSGKKSELFLEIVKFTLVVHILEGKYTSLFTSKMSKSPDSFFHCWKVRYVCFIWSFWVCGDETLPDAGMAQVRVSTDGDNNKGLTSLFLLDSPQRESPPDKVPFYFTSARRDNGVYRKYRGAPEPRAGGWIRVWVTPGGHSPGIWPKLTRTTQTLSA